MRIMLCGKRITIRVMLSAMMAVTGFLSLNAQAQSDAEFFSH